MTSLQLHSQRSFDWARKVACFKEKVLLDILQLFEDFDVGDVEQFRNHHSFGFVSNDNDPGAEHIYIDGISFGCFRMKYGTVSTIAFEPPSFVE